MSEVFQVGEDKSTTCLEGRISEAFNVGGGGGWESSCC